MSLFTRSGLAADSAGSSLRDRLCRPIDPASLVFFRVAFGVLIAWEMKRYNGRDPRRLIDPDVDLTRVSVPTFGADWIIPLDA